MQAMTMKRSKHQGRSIHIVPHQATSSLERGGGVIGAPPQPAQERACLEQPPHALEGSELTVAIRATNQPRHTEDGLLPLAARKPCLAAQSVTARHARQ